MKKRYVWDKEKQELVEKVRYEDDNKSIHIISDTMDPIKSMLDGRIYDSKSSLSRSYKERGYEETGYMKKDMIEGAYSGSPNREISSHQKQAIDKQRRETVWKAMYNSGLLTY